MQYAQGTAEIPAHPKCLSGVAQRTCSLGRVSDKMFRGLVSQRVPEVLHHQPSSELAKVKGRPDPFSLCGLDAFCLTGMMPMEYHVTTLKTLFFNLMPSQPSA
jgi:hypothetical protein